MCNLCPRLYIAVSLVRNTSSCNHVCLFDAAAIEESGQGIVDVDVEGVHTNIVMVKMVKSGLTPAEFCSRLTQVKCHVIFTTCSELRKIVFGPVSLCFLCMKCLRNH